MPNISFKERVKTILIAEAKIYQNAHIQFEYLVLADCFKEQPYYIIESKQEN